MLPGYKLTIMYFFVGSRNLIVKDTFFVGSLKRASSALAIKLNYILDIV